jgi:hypothetical protein
MHYALPSRNRPHTLAVDTRIFQAFAPTYEYIFIRGSDWPAATGAASEKTQSRMHTWIDYTFMHGCRFQVPRSITGMIKLPVL